MAEGAHFTFFAAAASSLDFNTDTSISSRRKALEGATAQPRLCAAAPSEWQKLSSPLSSQLLLINQCRCLEINAVALKESK